MEVRRERGRGEEGGWEKGEVRGGRMGEGEGEREEEGMVKGEGRGRVGGEEEGKEGGEREESQPTHKLSCNPMVQGICPKILEREDTYMGKNDGVHTHWQLLLLLTQQQYQLLCDGDVPSQSGQTEIRVCGGSDLGGGREGGEHRVG